MDGLPVKRVEYKANSMRIRYFLLAICSVLLAQFSCIKAVGPIPPGPPTPSSIVQYLGVTESAAEAILKAIGPSAGLSADQVVQISRLMSAIGNAVAISADEITNTAHDTLTKLNAIETAFRLAVIDSAVLDRLPSNVKSVVTTALAASDAAIAAIKAFYGQDPVVTARRAAQQPSFSAGDRAKLTALAARGRKLAVR